jgi:hypothetical protein
MKLLWLILKYHFKPRLTRGQAFTILCGIQTECRRLKHERYPTACQPITDMYQEAVAKGWLR